MILGCARSLHRKGARLILMNRSENVDLVLRTAGVHEVIPMVAGFDDALGPTGT
jgi:hypothetical protein